MNFERDDLDWALGELLHYIWQAKRRGRRVEVLYPEQFYCCMRVVNAQTFKVRAAVHRLIIEINPQAYFWTRLENVPAI